MCLGVSARTLGKHTPLTSGGWHGSEHTADTPRTAAQLPHCPPSKPLISLRLGLAAMPVSFRLGTASQATRPLSPRGLEPRRAESRVIAPEEANLQLLLPWARPAFPARLPLPRGSVYSLSPALPSLV